VREKRRSEKEEGQRERKGAVSILKWSVRERREKRGSEREEGQRERKGAVSI